MRAAARDARASRGVAEAHGRRKGHVLVRRGQVHSGPGTVRRPASGSVRRPASGMEKVPNKYRGTDAKAIEEKHFRRNKYRISTAVLMQGLQRRNVFGRNKYRMSTAVLIQGLRGGTFSGGISTESAPRY